VLGWLFVPFYLRSNVFTTPEFQERREFDRAVQRVEQKESLIVDLGAVADFPIVCWRRDE
jgi:hypothetical protein